jgi:hypothetical protein
VLSENRAMLGVFFDAGFSLTRRSVRGVVDIEMDTSATSRAVAAADQREAVAEARSLRSILSPRSVAVVGVRRGGSGVGAAILQSIREGGFAGPVYVVHPGVGEVLGVPAFPGSPSRVATSARSSPPSESAPSRCIAAIAKTGCGVVVSPTRAPA